MVPIAIRSSFSVYGCILHKVWTNRAANLRTVCVLYEVHAPYINVGLLSQICVVKDLPVFKNVSQ